MLNYFENEKYFKNKMKWMSFQDMEKLDHTGKPVLVSKKQQIAVATSPIASIDLSEKHVKLISDLVQKYNQVR